MYNIYPWHKVREYQGAFSDNIRRKTDMYLGSVKAMASSSPDVARFARELWEKVAMSAILYGCEAIPIRKAELDHLEATTSAVGKFILGLGVGAANVVANLAAGLKSGRYQYFLKVMRYHDRMERTEADPWVQDVWEEMKGYGEKSGYVKLIDWIEKEILKEEGWTNYRVKLDEYERERINTERGEKSSMTLMPRVKEGQICNRMNILEAVDDPVSLIEFLTYDAQLGNRTPPEGTYRQPYCPLCIKKVRVRKLTEPHILFTCESLYEVRRKWGLVDYKEERGGNENDLYGRFWRSTDEVKEIERRLEAACAVRATFWIKAGYERKKRHY